MFDLIDGKIKGRIDTSIQEVSGDISLTTKNMSGVVQPAGQTIVYDAQWGGIKGDIETQMDLQTELHKRDTEAIPISEVEKILYLD